MYLTAHQFTPTGITFKVSFVLSKSTMPAPRLPLFSRKIRKLNVTCLLTLAVLLLAAFKFYFPFMCLL